MPEAVPETLRTVLAWNYEDSLYSLRRRTFVKGYGIWRPLQGAVQVLEMRKDHDRGNQAANRLHRGDDSSSFLRARQCHQLEIESTSTRSRIAAAREQESCSQHRLWPLEGPDSYANEASGGSGPQRRGCGFESSGNFPAPLLAGSPGYLHQPE